MEDAEALARRIERMLDAGALPRRLAEVGASADAIGDLAAIAAKQ